MFKKIFKVTANLVLLIFIGIGLFVLFSSIPFPGNYKVFTVQSGSMEPAIKTGSLIFIKPQTDYAVGDIITKRTSDPKVTVTHRIVEEKEIQGNKVFMTKGDANDGKDSETVSPESIIGKVVLDIPYLGYPIGYAKTQQGFILLIIIPAVIILYEEFSKIRYEIQKKIRFRKTSKDKRFKNLDIFFHKKEDIDEAPKMDIK